MTEFLTYGDIYPNALDHFCAWVEEVSECPRTKKVQVISPLFCARSFSPFFGTRPTCSNTLIVSHMTSRSRCNPLLPSSSSTTTTSRCTSWRQQSSKSEDSSRGGRCCPFHRLMVMKVTMKLTVHTRHRVLPISTTRRRE